MLYTDFLEKCYDILKRNNCWVTETFKDPKTHEESKEKGRYGAERHSLTFSAEWSMGGTSGNCWNDDLRPISPDKEPDFPPELEYILEGLCPGVSDRTYRRIKALVEKSGTYTNADYYGGSETCGFKGFHIHDLFFELSQDDFLDGSKKPETVSRKEFEVLKERVKNLEEIVSMYH